jgi:hypothetical protein
MTDFTRVLLTDALAWELFGLAARERLLYTAGSDGPPTPRLGKLTQRTLSLLVLFDRVIVHDFSEGSFRVPDLESDGAVQVMARSSPVGKVEPLPTQWRLGPLGTRKRPPASLLRSLRLFKEERPLVIGRLLAAKSDWERSLAAALGVSRQRFLNAFFDYAVACVEGDRTTIQESILNRLPDEFLADLTRRLWDFKLHNELLDEVNAKLVFALAFADELRIIQELSQQLSVGVATGHYHAKHKPTSPGFDARSMADHLVVVRAALAEDRGSPPRIRDLRHALALRRDPNLLSLREMLVEFHKAVQGGEVDAMARARHEVAQAKRAMTRRRGWQPWLDWVTYLALPVGVAEALIGAPPVAGLSLASIGATGTKASSRTKLRHGWVLFNV